MVKVSVQKTPLPETEVEDNRLDQKAVNQFEKWWWIDGVAVALMMGLGALQLKSFWGAADKSNVFSAPMMPMLSGLASRLFRLEMWVAVTDTLLLAMVVSAPILYFFILYLTRRRLTALLGICLFLLPFEPFVQGRVKMAFLVGDGGHIVSVGFIPLVALPLLAFLRTGRFSRLVLASFSMALIALTTLFGSLAGLMTLGVVAFSEVLQGKGRLKLVRFGLFVLLTMGFVAFWYNPTFVLSYFNTERGKTISKTLVNLIPLSFVVTPVFGAFGFLLFEKKKQLQPLFIALGLTAMYTVIFFADYSNHLFPSHPRRYYPELGFSLAVLGGIMLTALIDYVHLKGRLLKYRLTTAGRQLATRAVLVFLVGGFGLITALKIKTIWSLPDAQILGLQTGEMALTSVWEARSKAGLFAEVGGYLISLLSISAVVVIWLRIKQAVGLAGMEKPENQKG